MSRERLAPAIALSAAAIATMACSTAKEPDMGIVDPANIDTVNETLVPSTPVHTLNVAYRSASSLIASTGNLYWTSNDGGQATVWRAGKGNIPGQEVALYSEPSPTINAVLFSNFVYAKTSDFFGYFVAQYANGAFIKRVPLAGGPAVTLATVPGIAAYDLATDQSTTLFWTDAGGVRKMPINGGTFTTLYSGSAGYVGLDASNVYFTAGAGIFRVPKAGGNAVQLTTNPGVTALYVDAAGGRIYWGELGSDPNGFIGSVRSVPVAGGAVVTYYSHVNWTVRGVGSDGSRVFWTQCGLGSERSHGCVLSQLDSGVVRSTNSGRGDNLDYTDVQWDASNVFFGGTFVNVSRTCVGANFGLAACGCDSLAATCAGQQCGTAIDNCGQTVTCPNTCAPPATCGSPLGPTFCCTSNGDPCGGRCGGTATDNCGNVFACHTSCGLDGDCPCRGGKCDPTSNFCSCSEGPCL